VNIQKLYLQSIELLKFYNTFIRIIKCTLANMAIVVRCVVYVFQGVGGADYMIVDFCFKLHVLWL
jgi:hypothetical protein